MYVRLFDGRIFVVSTTRTHGEDFAFLSLLNTDWFDIKLMYFTNGTPYDSRI